MMLRLWASQGTPEGPPFVKTWRLEYNGAGTGRSGDEGRVFFAFFGPGKSGLPGKKEGGDVTRGTPKTKGGYRIKINCSL